MGARPEPSLKMGTSPEPQAVMATTSVVQGQVVPEVSVPQVLPLESALKVVAATLLCAWAVCCLSAPEAVSEHTRSPASSKTAPSELSASSKMAASELHALSKMATTGHPALLLPHWPPEPPAPPWPPEQPETPRPSPPTAQRPRPTSAPGCCYFGWFLDSTLRGGAMSQYQLQCPLTSTRGHSPRHMDCPIALHYP